MNLAGIKKFVKEALSEHDGSPSSLRLNIFIGFTQWSVAITIGFFYVLLAQPTLILGYLGVLSGLVGGLVGLKVWQRKVEGADAIGLENTSIPTNGFIGGASSGTDIGTHN